MKKQQRNERQRGFCRRLRKNASERQDFPPYDWGKIRNGRVKRVIRSRNWFSTAFRNRTAKFYAVYTSVLDGNKNSKIYFYPPVNRPFHNSCPDNVYMACAICSSTSSEESATGICILGGHRDVIVMSLRRCENLVLDNTRWLAKNSCPTKSEAFHSVCPGNQISLVLFVS